MVQNANYQDQQAVCVISLQFDIVQMNSTFRDVFGNIKSIWDMNETDLRERLVTLMEEAKEERILERRVDLLIAGKQRTIEICMIRTTENYCITMRIYQQQLIEIKEQMIRCKQEISKLYTQIREKNSIIENQNQKLIELCLRDPLTGLYNRKYFYEKLTEEIIKSRRLKYDIAIMAIDIHDFEKVNETFGYREGDSLLKKFAHICKTVLRENIDIVFRTGGVEFTAIILNCDEKNAAKVGKRLEQLFKEQTDIASISYNIEVVCSEEDVEGVAGNLDSICKKIHADKRKQKSWERGKVISQRG